MINPHFEFLMEKYLAKDLSTAERNELQTLLQQNEQLRAIFAVTLAQATMLRRIERKKGMQPEHVKPTETAPAPFIGRSKSQRSRLFWATSSLVGLAGVIAVALTLNGYRQSNSVFTPKSTVNSAGSRDDILVESGQTLTLNAEECSGRKIITREQAAALIRFNDGTEIELKEGTQVKLGIADPQKGKELEAEAGLLVVNAAPQPHDRPLKINSPHGTVTVVGTLFWLTVDAQETGVDLLEGTVNLARVSDNATLQLNPGQHAVLASGAALAATPIRAENAPLIYSDWTPADIETRAWYDAADMSTVMKRSPGGPVIQWKDKSGNNNHVSSGEGGRVFSYRSLNGLHTVRFTGNSYLQNTANITGQPYSFAVIAKVNFHGRHPLFTIFDGNGGQRSSLNYNSFNQYSMDAGSVGPTGKDSPGHFFVSGVFNSKSSEMRINGGSALVGNAGPGDLSQGITIGKLSNSTDTSVDFGGFIGEIIISSGVWSTSDREKIEGYLAHKWRAAGKLPEKHPYKNMPPRKPKALKSVPML